MQRTKKKVQQSKPNHLVAGRFPSRVAPLETAPPPGARAASGPSPLAVRLPAPRLGSRAALWKGDEGAARTLPPSGAARAVAVGSAGRTPASPHPPHSRGRRDPGGGTKAPPGCGGGSVASFVSHNVEEKTKSQILIPLLWEIVTLTNTPACRGQRS